MGGDPAFVEDSGSFDGVVDAFVGSETGDGDEAERRSEWFGFELGQRFEIDTVADDLDVANTGLMEGALGGFGAGHELDVAVEEAVVEALLRLANPAPRPAVKGFPDGAEDFVEVGDAIGPAPPGRVPGDAMVLVDDEVERLLGFIPAPSLEDGGAATAAAYDVDAADGFFAGRTREIVGKPISFVSAFFEGGKIGLGDTFSATGERVFGVPPVQHQETH